MARILWELSEFSSALSHSFCRCTTFWRAQDDLRTFFDDYAAALSQIEFPERLSL